MAVSNIGSTITRTNTGNMASVSTSGIGAHVPVTPTQTINGNFTTTSDGQVISALHVNGVIIIKHNNVQVWNTEAYGAWIDDNKRGTKFYWDDFGITNGAVENTWGTTQIKGGDYTMVRCKLYGWIDHTRPRWGDSWHVECWFGPSYKDPTGHTNNTPAHCDPSQPHPPPGNVPFTSTLYQGCKFEIFPFQDRDAGYLSQIGLYDSNLMATCGTINNEFYKCPNGVMRDCEWRGNATQILMLQNGDNNTSTGQAGGTPFPPMEGWAVFDNIFDFTGQPAFGSSRAFCNFGNYSGHVSPTIEWGRNTDKNGNPLGAFYRSAPKATNDWSKTKPARAGSEYISFYTGTQPPPPDPGEEPPPPPDPVVQLVVTTPTPNQVFTSGSVTFVGGADTANGDLTSNYGYFQYHVTFPEEVQANGTVGTGRIYLDRDSSGNNSGFTFNTISAAGVTFTRRNGTAPETHKGVADLTIIGERTGTSTWPEKTIRVTFGDLTPPAPPTNLEFAVDVTARFDFQPKLNTQVGGIPKAQITMKPVRIPTAYITKCVPVWDRDKGGTDEEVVAVDANTFRRKYE